LNAYARYAKKMEIPFPLVLAGGKGWLENDLQEFIQGLGMAEHVRVLGYVSDEVLAWLYGNCYGFVYPSLYEGFGLPVLEAMEMGAAVITSNTTSIPEVGGDAVHYVDPFSEQDMVDGLIRFSRDEAYRKDLQERAIGQASTFSWEICAREVLHMYQEVLAMPKYTGHGS
jgi:glycosyltransferase involved in cell wall biosynthesis